LGRWKRLDRLPSVVARQQHSHFFMEMEPRSPVRPEPGQQFAAINWCDATPMESLQPILCPRIHRSNAAESVSGNGQRPVETAVVCLRRIYSATESTNMAKREASGNQNKISAQPRLHQRAREIQEYGTVSHMLPLELEEPVRLEMTEHLNQLLADSMTLRDLYKKSHWQVAGPTFYQLHLLFDKHYGEQVEIVDTIAERIQLLGGVSLAMAADIAETTQIERPPRGREEVPVQISRLIDAHQIIIRQCRELAERADKLGDDGTNDLAVSDVLRTNELQTWFLSEHLVDMPLVHAEEPQISKAG